MKRIATRPIFVGCSPLSGRIYAAKAWRMDSEGNVTVTGHKDDVTIEAIAAVRTHRQFCNEQNCPCKVPA